MIIIKIAMKATYLAILSKWTNISGIWDRRDIRRRRNYYYDHHTSNKPQFLLSSSHKYLQSTGFVTK